MSDGEPKGDRGRGEVGRIGEDLAGRVLTARGYRIAARRYRTRNGEIDLVAESPDGTVVFVEVKTRRGSGGCPGSASIGPRKVAALARTALRYLQERGWLDRDVRFDVVEIRLHGAAAPDILHLVDAFRPPS